MTTLEEKINEIIDKHRLLITIDVRRDQCIDALKELSLWTYETIKPNLKFANEQYVSFAQSIGHNAREAGILE